MRPRTQSPCVRTIALCIALLLPAAQCLAAGNAPELPDPGKPAMTRDQQKKIGLQVAAKVYQQMPVLPDSSPETKYIQDLGRRLYTTIPAERSWPFQFHVVAQKEINAFALPGGVMFVNLGTITAVENEAELAGVMAHEMAHVYMQHSAKQQEKGSVLGGLAGIVGAIAGSMGGALGTLAQAGIQVGAGTLMLKYSRGDEEQADAVGAIILWKAGFNPVSLADFFQKMQAKGGSGPQFLSDHPNPGNRTAAIQAEVREWPARRYYGDSPEFPGVRRHAAGVRAYTAQEIAAGAKSGQWANDNRNNGAVFADAPAEAVTQVSMRSVNIGDVRPSGNFRTTDLGSMKIDRPENWEVTGGQSSSATIAPRAGTSAGAVAYGVVVRAGRTPATNMSVAQLTTAIVQGLQSGDSNMRQISDIQQITVNGVPGGSTTLETASPMAGPDGKSQRERDWLVVLPRERGSAVYLIFVAPQTHFDELRPTFEQMLRTVHF